MLGSLRYRKAGYFIENVAARMVPTDDPGVDRNGLSKRLVAFGVVGVDKLPRRQHEHGGMEPVEREHGLQLVGRQWRCLVKRPEGIDQPAIKEDPAGSERLIDVLLDVSTQDLLGESESIRSTTRTGRKFAMMARADSATVA